MKRSVQVEDHMTFRASIWRQEVATAVTQAPRSCDGSNCVCERERERERERDSAINSDGSFHPRLIYSFPVGTNNSHKLITRR